MKMIIKLTTPLIMSVVILLSSCSQDDTVTTAHQEDILVEYSINLQGDEYLPVMETMSRSGSSNDLYGINILQTVYDTEQQKNVQSNLGYAYALVDDITQPLKIGLIKNADPKLEYRYTFECTYLPNGKAYTSIDDTAEYGFPYSLSAVAQKCKGCALTIDDAGSYFKASPQPDGSRIKLETLKDSRVYAFGTNCYHPLVDKYYGKTTIEQVDDTQNTVTIDLYRRFFALTCAARGLAQGERLEISLDDYIKYVILCTNTDQYEYGYQCDGDDEPRMDNVQRRFVSMKNTSNSNYEQNPLSKDVIENLTFKAVFFKNAQDEGTEVMTKQQAFKRNYDYTLTFSDINRTGTQPTVSVTVEDTPMDELFFDIPWSDTK